MPSQHDGLLNTALLAAASALIGAFALPLTFAGVRAESGPLVIAKQGYFFVGGTIDTKREGSPTVGHMYVEYQVPQKLAHPYPVVMIHGGSQTGTNFTGTPDGREGWAQYFLRRGYAVYVVDQVARGRAAQWSQANGPVSASNLARLEQRFVAPERFNLWPQAHLHTQWPGDGKPGDASFDSSMRASSRPWSISRCSRRSTATPPWRCSTASALPWFSSIPNPVRTSGRSPTSARTSSRRSSRSSRMARRPTMSTSRVRRTGSPTIRI